MLKIFYIVLLFGLIVRAEEAFTIQGKKIRFFEESQLRVTSSTACVLSKEKKHCSNFKFLNTISVKKLGRIPAGNPNTGALICEDQLDGKSIVGQDSSGNERSFCHLVQKNLYISNGSLTYWGNKNDGYYAKPETFDPGN
ncbi:MAG: hypothetical protein ACK5V3_05350 [Bdellovibrionales bacterium]